MGKQVSDKTIRDYGRRKRRQRRIRNTILGLIIGALVLGVSIYLFLLYHKNYQSYEVLSSEAIPGDNSSKFLDYKGGVVKYNKDGAVAYDKDGKLLWNGSYEMMDPVADVCENYVVVADRGSKLIHIFNETGFVSSIITLYDIIEAEIAKQGVVAVLMGSEKTSYVKLYHAEGTIVTDSNEEGVISEIVTQVDEAGYPMDLTISDDGKKLVISFLSFTSGKLVSTVGFYNFGEVGQNVIDRFVGGFEYEEIVVPKVSFVGNNTVSVFMENGFELYSMLEKPEKVKEEIFEQKIYSVFSGENHVGLVLEGTDSVLKQLLLYDKNGMEVMKEKLDFPYEQIYMSKDEIILHDNLSTLILKTNGREKFRYTFDSNVEGIYPINNLDKYYLITSSEISRIVLVE
ncbi:MAG TPA: hypothetical protein GXZ21_03530 [Clostridiales bacterium]|nr:hypothetical protein [Clostridiales bacterium]